MPPRKAKQRNTRKDHPSTAPIMPRKSVALTTPELLLQYFGYLRGKDLVGAAMVCKQWSQHALDTLWRTRIVPLSALMGRLKWLELRHTTPLDGDPDLWEEDDQPLLGWYPVSSSLSLSRVPLYNLSVIGQWGKLL